MRKILSPEEQQRITQLYMSGYTLQDLALEEKSSYATIRQVLVCTMNANSPHKERKRLWDEKKFIPVNDRSSAKKETRKMIKSKSIPVVLDLLFNKDLNHSEIARKNFCSREYVGQCAESCAHYGQDVTRELKHGKPYKRGKVA